MKALVFDGSSLYFRNDYPRPQPKKGEVLIKVLCAGICRTDIEIVRGYMNFSGVPGHEFVGIVEEVNGDYEHLKGKRVVGEINCACGECEYCRRGLRNHCPRRTVLGIWKKDGAMAEYLTLPAENLHILPDKISDEEAVFVEPLAACLRITEQVDFSTDSSVLVIGDGRMGLLCGAVMKEIAGKVKLLGKHHWKKKIAERMGLEVISYDSFSPSPAWDVVIEASGNPAALEVALECVRPTGRVVLKTTASQNWNLNLSSLVVNEITLIGSRCGPFDKAIEMLSRGQVNVSLLVTHTFPLEEGNEAFKAASSGNALKVLLYP